MNQPRNTLDMTSTDRQRTPLMPLPFSCHGSLLAEPGNRLALPMICVRIGTNAIGLQWLVVPVLLSLLAKLRALMLRRKPRLGISSRRFRPSVGIRYDEIQDKGMKAKFACSPISIRRSLAQPLCAFILVALSGGCSNLGGPEYERPEVPEKTNWSELEDRELKSSDVIRMDWWTAFGDPYLDQLIDTALVDGLDLRIAFLRLEKAGITLRRQRFPLTPEIKGGPTAEYRRGQAEDGPITSQHNAEAFGVNLSWELDIWGKVRKSVMAAEANYKSSEMDWRAVYLTLVTSVSEQYFQIRQFDEQITQQETALEQSQGLLKIWEKQHQEGLVAETKILSQQSEISSRRQQLLELQRSRSEAELKLATLLGKPAGSISVPQAPLRESVSLIPEPNVLPGDLLTRRPDILKAEYNLLAGHNLLGEARLARLPSFTLTGSAGTGDGLTPLVARWNYAFLLDWTSFLDRNKKIAVVENEAEVKILTESYRNAVLRAFEEVELALLNLKARQAQLKELKSQVAALEVVHRVQQAQLQEGLVSQLEVFDTERTLLDAQQSVLSNYRTLLSDTLVLYKAVGGGWAVETVANKL